MLKIAIVTGSTRPGRNNEAVARWVFGLAKERKDAEFEFVDIADYKLPLLDEPVPPSMGQYSHEHTKAWAAKIATFDAYVFVTPEYNHGISGALKKRGGRKVRTSIDDSLSCIGKGSSRVGNDPGPPGPELLSLSADVRNSPSPIPSSTTDRSAPRGVRARGPGAQKRRQQPDPPATTPRCTEQSIMPIVIAGQ